MIHSAAASPLRAPHRTRHRHSKAAEYSEPSGGRRFIASPWPAAPPVRTSKEKKQVAKNNSNMMYPPAVCTRVLVLFNPISFRSTKVPVYDHDRRRARLETHFAGVNDTERGKRSPRQKKEKRLRFSEELYSTTTGSQPGFACLVGAGRGRVFRSHI